MVEVVTDRCECGGGSSLSGMILWMQKLQSQSFNDLVVSLRYDNRGSNTEGC